MRGTNVELMILNQGGAAENPARQAGERKSGDIGDRNPASAAQALGAYAADVRGMVGDGDRVVKRELGWVDVVRARTSANLRPMWGAIQKLRKFPPARHQRFAGATAHKINARAAAGESVGGLGGFARR